MTNQKVRTQFPMKNRVAAVYATVRSFRGVPSGLGCSRSRPQSLSVLVKVGDCSFIGDRGSLLIDWERGSPPFQLNLVLKHQNKACLSESGARPGAIRV
eukprot:scaffold614_cov378-Pavlova_lutheri.AAC.1